MEVAVLLPPQQLIGGQVARHTEGLPNGEHGRASEDHHLRLRAERARSEVKG